MADNCLIQAPLLVWPENFLDATERFWQRVNSTRHVVQQELDEQRSEELTRLGQAIERDFPHLQRSAQYYKTLVAGSREKQPFATLNFIRAGPNVQDRIAAVQLGDRPPPPKPRPLQVVFHRG